METFWRILFVILIVSLLNLSGYLLYSHHLLHTKMSEMIVKQERLEAKFELNSRLTREAIMEVNKDNELLTFVLARLLGYKIALTEVVEEDNGKKLKR